jgi:acyl carrier protein
MDTASLAQEVRSFIAAEYLLGRDDDLADNASFLEEGILDSTGVLQLISFMEETYGIKVEDEEVVPDNLDSINKVVAYLCRKLNPVPTPECRERIAGTLEDGS